MRWHILTGEYPPQPGGVSDYTLHVANGLAQAQQEVHVWCPATEGESFLSSVHVHRLPGCWGIQAITQVHQALKKQPGRLLVQYVPQMYGYKGMNLLFAFWLRFCCPLRPWVMFHEVAFPIDPQQSRKHNLLGWVTHRMATWVAQSASRSFVSIPAWATMLRRLVPRLDKPIWLPIPATILPSVSDTKLQTTSLPRIGHFGTYGTGITQILGDVLRSVCQQQADVHILLLGRGSKEYREQWIKQNPALADHIHATGQLSDTELVQHLRSCTCMLQTFPDGVSCRRTSMMNLLANGIPTVTTRGHLTESIWESRAVVLVPVDQPQQLVPAVLDLLKDVDRRERMQVEAKQFYRDHFAIERTIQTLLQLSDSE